MIERPAALLYPTTAAMLLHPMLRTRTACCRSHRRGSSGGRTPSQRRLFSAVGLIARSAAALLDPATAAVCPLAALRTRTARRGAHRRGDGSGRSRAAAHHRSGTAHAVREPQARPREQLAQRQRRSADTHTSHHPRQRRRHPTPTPSLQAQDSCTQGQRQTHSRLQSQKKSTCGARGAMMATAVLLAAAVAADSRHSTTTRALFAEVR